MHTTTGMSSSSAMRCRRRATQQRGSRAISTRRRRGRGSVQTTIRRRIPKRRAMLANLQESDLQRRHAMRRKRRSSRAGISRKGAASLALTVSLATTSSRKNLRQRQQQQKPGRLPIKRLRRLPISSRRMGRPGSVDRKDGKFYEYSKCAFCLAPGDPGHTKENCPERIAGKEHGGKRGSPKP